MSLKEILKKNQMLVDRNDKTMFLRNLKKLKIPLPFTLKVELMVFENFENSTPFYFKRRTTGF